MKLLRPKIAIIISSTLLAFLYIGAQIEGGIARPQSASQPAPKAAAKTQAASKTKPAPKAKSAEVARAGDKTPVEQTAFLKPVLEPGQFFGEAMIGYSAAKAAPDVMAKLFCYCGCDETDHHSRLLDCFTSIHGVDCHICQEEAKLALRMHREGSTTADIQKQVDQQYSAQYPFEKPTKTLEEYKANRLWKQTSDREPAAGQTDGKGDGAAKASSTAGSGGKAAKAKLKPGAKVGTCCAAKPACCAGDSKKNTKAK